MRRPSAPGTQEHSRWHTAPTRCRRGRTPRTPAARCGGRHRPRGHANPDGSCARPDPAPPGSGRHLGGAGSGVGRGQLCVQGRRRVCGVLGAGTAVVRPAVPGSGRLVPRGNEGTGHELAEPQGMGLSPLVPQTMDPWGDGLGERERRLEVGDGFLAGLGSGILAPLVLHGADLSRQARGWGAGKRCVFSFGSAARRQVGGGTLGGAPALLATVPKGAAALIITPAPRTPRVPTARTPLPGMNFRMRRPSD